MLTTDMAAEQIYADLTAQVEAITKNLKEGSIVTASFEIKSLAVQLDRLGFGAPLKYMIPGGD